MRTHVYTKAILVVIVSPLILIPNPTALRAQSRKTAPKPSAGKASTLDQEARKVAQAHWDSWFTKCGQSYYTVGGFMDNEFATEAPTIYLDAQGIPRWRRPPKWSRDRGEQHPGDKAVFEPSGALEVFEYKGDLFRDLSVYADPLSPGDRLNGVEWRGGVTLAKPLVYRHRVTTSISENQVDWQPWGEWLDLPGGNLRIVLKKVNGQWFTVGNNAGPIDDLGAVIESCSADSEFLPFKASNARQPKTPAIELADTSAGIDRSHIVVVSAEGVRYAAVSHARSTNPLHNFTFDLTGTLPVGTTLLAHSGTEDREWRRVGTTLPGIGPAYLFTIADTGRAVLVPISDLEGKTKPEPK